VEIDATILAQHMALPRLAEDFARRVVARFLPRHVGLQPEKGTEKGTDLFFQRQTDKQGHRRCRECTWRKGEGKSAILFPHEQDRLTVETAAGAIHSGQGCIKVGLLGLTLEEMKPFIRGLKPVLGYYLRRDQHQRLVFIDIVDEPLVTEQRVLIDLFAIAMAFIDLIRRGQHNILLLDTLHKGAQGRPPGGRERRQGRSPEQDASARTGKNRPGLISASAVPSVLSAVQTRTPIY
jgi:hypothetical protein